MPRQFKVTASITFVLAVVFYLFFQISKHNVALSQVNAFADDPYDAVGSFGVQFALFTALLSLLRAFRPYQSGQALDSQKLLLLRAEYLSCLSVAVTLVADIIAMIRHLSTWIGLPAGYTLAVLTGGMILLTVLEGWFISHSGRNMRLPSPQNIWIRAISISVVSVLVLAFYPENWRQSVPGELFTVLVGTAFLFVPVWAIGIAISPYSARHCHGPCTSSSRNARRGRQSTTDRAFRLNSLYFHWLRMCRCATRLLPPRKAYGTVSTQF